MSWGKFLAAPLQGIPCSSGLYPMYADDILLVLFFIPRCLSKDLISTWLCFFVCETTCLFNMLQGNSTGILLINQHGLHLIKGLHLPKLFLLCDPFSRGRNVFHCSYLCHSFVPDVVVPVLESMQPLWLLNPRNVNFRLPASCPVCSFEELFGGMIQI